MSEIYEDINPSDMRRPKKDNYHSISLASWQNSLSTDELSAKALLENPELIKQLKVSEPELSSYDNDIKDPLLYDEDEEEEEDDDDDDDDDDNEDESEDIDQNSNLNNNSQKPSPGLKTIIEINEKIFVWIGNIATLQVDAIVNPTNERMTSKYGVSGAIMDGAGYEIYEELLATESCKIGESRLTKGYCLPASWIIHTVGPRYNTKYITAAENALHNCYRSCLDTAVENKFKTIAIPPLHSLKRGYPIDKGSHIALRTIRRFMEKYHEHFEKIILVFDNEEEKRVYESNLCLYFPRNEYEEELSKKLLPSNIGNQFGEIEIEERKIRIQAFPYSETEIISNQSLTDVPSNLTIMKEDRDIERINRLNRTITEEEKQINSEYLNYLALSHQIDLSHIENLGVFYQSGHDSRGRPIMVIVGMKLPEKPELLDHFLLYYIKKMDTIANNPYILIYLHTYMSKKSKPKISWLRKVHDIMDCKYGDHLQALYVLHPTFWLKALKPVVSVFMGRSNKIFSKIVYTNSIAELMDLVSCSSIVIPEEIKQYDISINGSTSYTSTIDFNSL